jgi:hypothetical protein
MDHATKPSRAAGENGFLQAPMRRLGDAGGTLGRFDASEL